MRGCAVLAAASKLADFSKSASLLQLVRHRRHRGVELGKQVAGALLAQVFPESNHRANIKILELEAISVIRHDSQQLTVLAKYEVTARRIEFSEQPFQETAVQLYIARSGHIQLEFAF